MPMSPTVQAWRRRAYGQRRIVAEKSVVHEPAISDEAIDDYAAAMGFDPQPVDDAGPEVVAFHEAGHAAAARKLGCVVTFAEAGQNRGQVEYRRQVPQSPTRAETFADVRQAATIAFAGGTASARFLGLPERALPGGTHDVRKILRRMLDLRIRHHEIRDTLNECFAEAETLIEAGWGEVKRVAADLARRGRIGAPS